MGFFLGVFSWGFSRVIQRKTLVPFVAFFSIINLFIICHDYA